MSAQPTSHREVSPLELFYDLVFVFAVSQLSHHLLEDLTWRGAAETAIALVAVCGVWASTSFDATLLDVERPRTKAVLVGLMVLGLFMNAGISRAFAGDGWMFVVPLVAILVGHNVVMSRLAPDPVLRGHYRRALAWTIGSSLLWFAGAASGSVHRIEWWGAAAAVELLGFWLAHPLPGRRLHSEHVDLDADHMLERLRLFLIILFGETVLTVGRVIAAAPVTAATATASVAVILALLCLWGTYFGGGERLVAAHLGSTSDPIRSVRLGANVAYGALAGLVAVAVGSEIVIVDPLGRGSGALSLLLFGGIAVYLTSQAWYFRVAVRGAWVERLTAAAAVAAVGVLALWVSALGSLLLLDVVLVVVTVRLFRVHQRVAGASAAARSKTSPETG